MYHFSSQRLEAFSDGVVAILITVMVFDLKLPEGTQLAGSFVPFAPLLIKLGVYALSFLMLGIMWVNHHQLLHQIKAANHGLLWYNLHLLFWMSLVPLAAHLVGNYPQAWAAAGSYGLIFAACAQSFSLLRRYARKHQLLHERLSTEALHRRLQKNRLAIGLYLLAAAVGGWSVYVSYTLYLLLPTLYLIPESTTHQTTTHEI